MKKKQILPQIGMIRRKVRAKQQKECQTKIMRKTPEQRSSNQKYLTCQAKRCPGIKLIFFCADKNLHPHLSAIILNLNLTYKIKRADCDLLSFSKTKKQTILKTFFKNNLPLPHLEIRIEI